MAVPEPENDTIVPANPFEDSREANGATRSDISSDSSASGGDDKNTGIIIAAVVPSVLAIAAIIYFTYRKTKSKKGEVVPKPKQGKAKEANPKKSNIGALLF